MARSGSGHDRVGEPGHDIIARDHKPTGQEHERFLSSTNSYLGIMKHYRNYMMRRGMTFQSLSAWWWNYAHLTGGIGKFALKQRHSVKKNRDTLCSLGGRDSQG